MWLGPRAGCSAIPQIELLEAIMAKSLLSPGSRSIATSGFMPDLPANSGETEGTFFLGAPYGTKQEKTFTNKNSDGTEYEVRKVRYSVLVNGGKNLAFIELRKSDFCDRVVDGKVIIGQYGDDSMEQLLDSMLYDARQDGIAHDIPVIASFDYETKDKQTNKVTKHAGRDGVCFLA
jgi:hypothetical protein